jgi:hypoxanthine phosphoribosyltransferase
MQVTELIPKRFVSAQELSDISFQLADRLYKQDVRPTWIITLWRGGAPVGLRIHEYMMLRGLKMQHVPITTSSYTAIGTQSAVTILGTEHFVQHVRADDTVLIVDDMFDTGNTMQALLENLSRQVEDSRGIQLPRPIIATAFYKPRNRVTAIAPDYCGETVDEWIVFDHELVGLSQAEITQFHPALAEKIWGDACK